MLKPTQTFAFVVRTGQMCHRVYQWTLISLHSPGQVSPLSQPFSSRGAGTAPVNLWEGDGSLWSQSKKLCPASQPPELGSGCPTCQVKELPLPHSHSQILLPKGTSEGGIWKCECLTHRNKDTDSFTKSLAWLQFNGSRWKPIGRVD